MTKFTPIFALGTATLLAAQAPIIAQSTPKVPRFSVDYMDKSVEPGADFFHYADGTWLKNNPVPPDKSRWAGFIELQERNWHLIHDILESTCNSSATPNSPAQKVGDFYRSGMDTNRLEQLGFKPLAGDLQRIEAMKSREDLMQLVADFHQRGVDGCFSANVSPDSKNSSIYAFYLAQGGLGMPDRDYYLTEQFAKQRGAYGEHIAKMLCLLGEPEAEAKTHSATVLELET